VHVLSGRAWRNGVALPCPRFLGAASRVLVLPAGCWCKLRSLYFAVLDGRTLSWIGIAYTTCRVHTSSTRHVVRDNHACISILLLTLL
jgi:hypothetical protein